MLLKINCQHLTARTRSRHYWFCDPHLDWANIKRVTTHNSLLTVHQLTQNYEDVFQGGLYTIKKFKARLQLTEGSRPRFFHPRPVPFALKEAIEREVTRLEQNGSLIRMEHSDWASPFVPVPKKDGTLQLCGDYKVFLNEAQIVDQYPLPKSSDLFTCLTGGTRFTKLWTCLQSTNSSCWMNSRKSSPPLTHTWEYLDALTFPMA